MLRTAPFCQGEEGGAKLALGPETASHGGKPDPIHEPQRDTGGLGFFACHAKPIARRYDATRWMSPADGAKEFGVKGYRGSLGIIEGSSRKFCSTCNRVRITPQGMLKVCLYDNGVLDLKELIRGGITDEGLLGSIRECLNKRFADGHQTESANGRAEQPSMASIGG